MLNIKTISKLVGILAIVLTGVAAATCPKPTNAGGCEGRVEYPATCDECIVQECSGASTNKICSGSTGAKECIGNSTLPWSCTKTQYEQIGHWENPGAFNQYWVCDGCDMAGPTTALPGIAGTCNNAVESNSDCTNPS